MHKLIVWVRHLRHIPFFAVSFKSLVIILMLLGTWVATRELDFIPDANEYDKVVHVIVFFGFALLMDLAVDRHPFWLWKGLPLLIYGASIEIMQYFSPDRTFSLLDLLADFSGILLYFIMKLFFIRVGARRSLGNEY